MAARLNALARTIIGPGVVAANPTTTITAASRSTFAAAAATTTTTTRSAHIHQHRMASTATEVRKFEWLVVIPDKPGMMAKRLEVRPQHFEGLTKAKESGLFKMGGEWSFLLCLETNGFFSLIPITSVLISFGISHWKGPLV